MPYPLGGSRSGRRSMAVSAMPTGGDARATRQPETPQLAAAPARSPRRRSFSLMELVLVIIAMLAAIAVPRVSHAARSAKGKSLAMTLTHVRHAIERYYAEHGRYPGYDPETGGPDDDAFVNQLTQYSDARGKSHATLVFPFIYGPYVRAPFPASPLNELNTVHVRANLTDPVIVHSTGWDAVLATGHFSANSSPEDLARVGITDPGGPASMLPQIGGG